MLLEQIKHINVQKPMKAGSIQKNMVGAGQDMIAMAHDKHPGSVIKVNKTKLTKPIQNDPIYKFTKIAMDQAPTNPYFPRIYKARVLKNRFGFEQLYVVMERLHKIDDKKLRDVFQFHKEKLGIQHYQFKDWKEMQTDFNDPSEREIILDQATDPKFVEAMKIITSNDIGLDFHFGNIMFRLTAHGPQLVLIDPYAPAGSSLGR